MISTIQHQMLLFCLQYIAFQRAFKLFQTSRSTDMVEIAKHGPNRPQTWPQNDPNNPSIISRVIPLQGTTEKLELEKLKKQT